MDGKISSESKIISCGIIITDGNVVLGCESRMWDLPKGELEGGETYLECALRETKEETGLIIDPSELKELGLFEYTKRKNLYLFLYKTNDLPEISKMECSSYFIIDGKKELEAKSFKYIPFDIIEGFFYRSICNVLRKLSVMKVFN